MLFAYAVCSLNYLPFAKALGHSILRYNPECRFFIGVVDKFGGQTKMPDDPFTYIEVEKLKIPKFAEMCESYTIHELCCACKPFFASYLLETNPAIEKLLYFDTDILVFSDLKNIETALDNCNMLLTPHITKPLDMIDDTLYPQDEIFIGAGIYNAGFFGLRRTAETFRLLDWWKERLQTKCRIQLQKGTFADQSWLALMPLFFEGVKIERNPGYNAAYWNLHERQIKRDSEIYEVNHIPLVFYHFSGYRFERPEEISLHQNRYTFRDFPVLKSLFDEYRKVVLREGYEGFIALPNYYAKPRLVRLKTNLQRKLKKGLKRL